MFVEFRTYRYRAHSMFDPDLYRDKAEIEQWKTRGPIHTFTARLKAQGDLTEERFLEIDAQVRRGSGPRGRVRRSRPAGNPSRTCTQGRVRAMTITYREALRMGLREALARDPRVFLMGEDVGRYGGTYAVSKGLLEEFGPDRVRDAPLSELAFVGAGIGAALGGLKPIVEVMTVNFSLLPLDQIVNTAAILRHMSGGQFSVPLVIRMATGAGRQLAAQHSHSFEGWYAHIPGLKIVTPATIDDAHGMLGAALEDPNPVLVFEYPALFDTAGELSNATIDISRAAVRRQGTRVTLVAYGGCVPKALAAADRLAAEGINAEVVDLRVLRPLDMDTVLASVRKTRRAVIVDEGWRSGSLSAEIMARIMEQAFYDLDAPVARVCREEVPIPYAKHLEEAALPQPDRIVAAAKGLFQ